MNPLHKAYQVLGLEPGTSMEAVKRRYKRLVLVWHPDRMQNDDGRCDAEEELKRINHAFDILKKHFDCQHKPGPTCDCQPVAGFHGHGAADPGAKSGSGGTGTQQKSQEEEARRRHEERRRQAEEAAQQAAADAARKAAEQQQAAADAARRANEQAVKREQALLEEKLRWRVALAVGCVLVAMLAFGFIGEVARSAISSLQTHWNNQHPETSHAPESGPSSTVGTGTSATSDDPDRPYIPMQYRVPGGNPASWRRFMEDEERKQQQREEEQHKQDKYFTRLAIDRNQRIIDHCTTTIAQLEARIADPNVSEFDKSKLRAFRDFQQQNLDAAQNELRQAQDKLN